MNKRRASSALTPMSRTQSPRWRPATMNFYVTSAQSALIAG
ncbi:unnamed protein product [Dibothriocephalus latus]|uniref:Uncharacterized protein n=1 Tax=Dibothriocephalus latus TaxID=60516 RepID=A0A3P7RJT9_DIBLA|nr:unnamed protein product [Dibothriocephalus latus]